MMETFLFISFFFIAILGIGLWVAKRSRSRQLSLPSKNRTDTLSALPPARALFANEESLAAFIAEETNRVNAEKHAAWLVRARGGDLSTLDETSADATLYRMVLDGLTTHATRQNDHPETLNALTRYVLQHSEWRATSALASAWLARWEAVPTSGALGSTLHLAALSDDAACFQHAVEAVLKSWRAGQMTRVSPGDLQALIESEYWILSPEARHSGAGFFLKRRLVAARRELAAVAQPASA